MLRFVLMLTGHEPSYLSVKILKIKKVKSWPDTLRSICLPDEDANFNSGSLCIVSGWGATEEANVSPFVSDF